MEDWAAVQLVYRQKKSIRQTAKTLGISRNTVRKLIELDEQPVYQRSIYKTKVDAFKDDIIRWKNNDLNGTRIFKELQKIGYDGSISPVYRFLNKLSNDSEGCISRKATVRIETPPGDQAQFDWIEYEVLVNGRYQKVYCFALILAASRKKAVVCSLRCDADSIYEAIQDLFEEFGGVTLELLIDNPKALVVENNPKSQDEIRYNPHALMMAKTLGTELNACPCYWPRKKGKIERPFKYIEEQFIKGNSFSSMAELNATLKNDVYEWCNCKHSTTQRIPNEHYLLEEKQALLPLPAKRYEVSSLSKRKVSNDSFVHINSNKYSVPVRYVGKNVYFRIVYGFRIEIYNTKKEKILVTEMLPDKGMVLQNPEHYADIAPKVSTSIPQIRRDFTAMFTNGAAYLEEANQRFVQPTHHARKIMELQDMYSIELLDRIIGISIETDKMDFKSFKSLLLDYNNGKLKLDVTKSSESSEEISLTRDCSYYEEFCKGEFECRP